MMEEQSRRAISEALKNECSMRVISLSAKGCGGRLTSRGLLQAYAEGHCFRDMTSRLIAVLADKTTILSDRNIVRQQNTYERDIYDLCRIDEWVLGGGEVHVFHEEHGFVARLLGRAKLKVPRYVRARVAEGHAVRWQHRGRLYVSERSTFPGSERNTITTTTIHDPEMRVDPRSTSWPIIKTGCAVELALALEQALLAEETEGDEPQDGLDMNNFPF